MGMGMGMGDGGIGLIGRIGPRGAGAQAEEQKEIKYSFFKSCFPSSGNVT